MTTVVSWINKENIENPLLWTVADSRLSDLHTHTPAKGFLTKDACYLTLEAVKVISVGKTYLQPDLALKLIHYRENPQINLSTYQNSI
jgi:hypothetical protein